MKQSSCLRNSFQKAYTFPEQKVLIEIEPNSELQAIKWAWQTNNLPADTPYIIYGTYPQYMRDNFGTNLNECNDDALEFIKKWNDKNMGMITYQIL